MDNVMMDSEAQSLFINSMLSKPELFSRVNHILQPQYFDPEYQGGVKFIKEYFQENRTIPGKEIYYAATKQKAEIFEIQQGDVQFLAEQIASFCQLNAVINAVKKSPALIEKSDFGTLLKMIKDASEIGLVTDFGIDYFDKPLERLERTENADALISTGWRDVDAVIGGGIGRQELITFLAPSGGGKSVSMLNLGYNLLNQGLHGVYFSMEMADRKVALRTDQMIAKLASGMINMNKQEVANAIELFSERTGSKFFIKRFREGTTTSNDFAAYLKQLESEKGFRPDFIIADYLDIMAPVQKVDMDSMFLKDKYVSEEFRALAFDYDCIAISASQLEKGATEKILEGKSMHQGNVQGGSSKTNTSDLMIATVKTDAMHEAGEYRFEFPKARNSGAAGKKVLMSWDSKTLRITDYGSKLELKKKSSLQMEAVQPGKTLVKPKNLNDLLGKYNETITKEKNDTTNN